MDIRFSGSFWSQSSGPKFESPYYYPDITFESMWKRSGDGWNQEMEDYWNLWNLLFSEMVSQFVDRLIIHVTFNRNLSDETVVMQWNKNIFALL